MSNRDMSLGGMQISTPSWAGDFFDRDALMPGGARIDATQFSTYPGPVTVRVGAIGTAAAAVAQPGMVGNGTVSAPTSRIGAQTETITIKFLTPTTFSVTGSVTGAQPGGSTGVAYTAPGVPNFTITAGATPFAAGDTWTIASTQSAVTPAAAVSATTIPVAGLSAALPAGAVLNFGVNGRFAVLALNAAANAESITVMPLDQAILPGDKAIYAGSPAKIVQSGTFVSRTYAQRNAGLGFHPAIAGEDEFFLIAFDIPDASKNDECELVRPWGVIVKENFLPGWQALSGALQTQVRATYKTTLGAE